MYKWNPLYHMIEVVKKVIDEGIKNLHPDIENTIISEILELGIIGKLKILKFIRERLKIPKQGIYTQLYWERRGWSNDEIKELKPKLKKLKSPMKVETWLDKINEDTGRKYTIDEAKYKIRSFRKLNMEYWIVRGYSEEDAISKVKEFQKDNSDKFLKKYRSNPSNYDGIRNTQIKYWTDKGYTEDEAIINIKKRQDTSSIEYYINRHGEEKGIEYYNNRCDIVRYTSSRKYRIDKYGEEVGNLMYDDILKKRIVSMSKCSIESYRFLIPIYKHLRKSGISLDDIYWGVGKSNEWFLNRDGNLFFYDFTIRSLGIIIEYHGIKFHPKRGLNNEELKKWKCLYSNIGYDEKLNMDILKEKIAIKCGFDYYYVYSDDNLLEKQEYLIKIINDKIKICQKK